MSEHVGTGAAASAAAYQNTMRSMQQLLIDAAMGQPTAAGLAVEPVTAPAALNAGVSITINVATDGQAVVAAPDPIALPHAAAPTHEQPANADRSVNS